jgi:hypothetical protein
MKRLTSTKQEINLHDKQHADKNDYRTTVDQTKPGPNREPHMT